MMHYPVMLPEVLEALNPKENESYVDGTFGNGGYSEAILKAANCNVVGLDRDPHVAPRARELSRSYDNRFRLVETPFSNMDQLDIGLVDAVILDIGVSSMQFDQAERGFSFMRSGPLDMRMGVEGPTAKDAIKYLSRRAADFIVRAREEANIDTTEILAELIEKALGRTGKIHPATRVFQALRIFINDELGELYRGLCAAEKILKPGGRLIVVTFHSLEDRIVKSFLRRRAGEVSGGSRYAPEIKRDGPEASFALGKRSVIKPSKKEVEENPRSRSAKLRFAIRMLMCLGVRHERLYSKSYSCGAAHDGLYLVCDWCIFDRWAVLCKNAGAIS